MEETDCGHTVVPGPDGPEHHEIPDDDADHQPSPQCPCGPQLAAGSPHLVYLHADQGADPEDPDTWESLFAT